MIENKLYFCDECKHIYYNFPQDQHCKVCGVQMNEKDVLTPKDVWSPLICETCHSIYTPQNPKNIIPQIDEKQSYLCGCIHQCPPKSQLQVGIRENFLGNIVLGRYYQCTNDSCKAIYIHHFEDEKKKCIVCNSRLEIVENVNPQSHNIYFQCANKNHGIRLKLRDLINNNNMQINHEMTEVKKRESILENEFDKLKTEILSVKGVFVRKTVVDKKINDLIIKSRKKREKLYEDFYSKEFRCNVFKSDSNGKLIQTNQGCKSLARLFIREKEQIDDEQTFIDKPSSQKSIEESQVEEKQTDYLNRNLKEEILSGISSNMVISATPFRYLSNINDENTHNIPDTNEEKKKEIDQPEFYFDQLPPLEKNQIYIKIELWGSKDSGDFSKGNYFALNYGVIPLEFDQIDGIYKIGREEIVNALWVNPEFFKVQPFLFNNITGNTIKSTQFIISKKNNEYLVELGQNAINKAIYIINDEKNLLIEQKLISKLDFIKINSYYSFDHTKPGIYQKFFFKFYFQF